MENGKIDIFFTTNNDAADIENIDYLPLKKSHFYALISEDNPLSQRKQIEITNFSNQRMLFIDDNWTGLEMIKLQDLIQKNNENLAITYTNDVSSQFLLVKSLTNICLGLSFIFNKADSNLKWIPLKYNRVLTYGAVISKRNEDQAVKELVKFLKESNV